MDALVVGSGTSGDQETLQVEGTCSNNATLVTKNTAFTPDSDAINSTGQVLLGSTACGNNATLTIGTSLAESSGGVLETDTGAGGTRLISGSVTSGGTTNIDDATQYSGGTWDNTGALNLATGEMLTAVSGTPTATFTDDNGGSVVSTGTGQLIIDSGNTYNQGNGTTSGGEPVLLSNTQTGTAIALHYTGTGASTVETTGLGTLDGTIASGQTLDITGTCSDNATENEDASLTSKGSVHLTSSACGNQSMLAVGTGFTFTNGSGGVLQTDVGNTGNRFISGNVTNDGTTNIDTSSQYTSGTWDNAGALNLADGTTLTAETATPIATFTNDTGGSITSNGTNATGQLVIDSGNIYNQGNGTTAGEPVLLSNSQTGTSIALHYTGTGASTVETQGAGTLDGNLGTGQTLDINGFCSDNATETTDASLTSKGSVHLTSSGCGNQSMLAVGTGFTFTNGAGGVLETDSGAGGIRYITGKVTNDGTTTVDASSQYTAGKWDNAGAMNIADGVTFIAETATSVATFTDDTGGSVTSSGTAHTGQLVIDSGNTYNQGNGTTSGEPVLLSNSQTGASIPLHYTGTGVSTVETQGAGTLDGNIATGQTLEVNGTCSDNATETLDASLSVSGTVDLTSSGCGNISTLAVPKPLLLTVNKTGQINTNAGVGGARFLSGNITNSGKVNINDATTYTPIKKGKFTNSGKLTIASGLTLGVASVTKSVFFNTKKGVITGTGQLVINDKDTFNQGAGKITGTPVLVHTASATTPATLDITGTGKGPIEVEGSTKFAGNIAAGQTVTVLGTCSLNAVLTGSANVSNAGTLDLSSVSCGNSSTFALPAGDTLTNAATGVIETLAGAGGAKTISANVANNGTIGPSGAQTLTIDGNLTDGATAVFDASVASSSSDLIAMGAGDTATLGGSLVAVPVAGFTPTSGYSATVLSGTYSGTFTTVGPAGWSATYPTGSVKLNFT